MNLTQCAGVGINLIVPMEKLRPVIPAEFQIVEAFPGVAYLFYETISCVKSAAFGKDVGPVTVTELRVAVQPPSSVRPAQGNLSQYLVAVQTNSSVLSNAFAGLGVETKNIGLQNTVNPAPTNSDIVSGKILESGQVHTEYEFAVPKAFKDATFKARWFHGKSLAFADVGVIQRQSQSNGPAAIRITDASPINAYLDGNLGSSLATRIDARVEQWG